MDYDTVLKTLENVGKQQYIYLTTKGRRTGKPHIVQLWFATANDKVYLSHEGAYTDWMKNLIENGSVSFKIGTVTLNGKAVVADGSSRETGKQALYEKYYSPASKDVIDDWFSLSTVIEVTLV